MLKLGLLRLVFCLAGLTTAAADVSHAQIFTPLVALGGAKGASPYSGLVQGVDGNFYGTTYSGSAGAGFGTVYKVTPRGVLTTLHTFKRTDGSYPYAGLVLARDGYFYGTTENGGANGNGTFYRVTNTGTFTVVHSFTGYDGSLLFSTPIEGTDGSFYGVSQQGGSNGYGTIYKITADGNLATLYNFCAITCLDGALPAGALFQAPSGDFYGASTGGGDYGQGNIFSISTSGFYQVVYNFCSKENCADGRLPGMSLVAFSGSLYGTTAIGGSSAGGGSDGFGTVYKIDGPGTITTVLSFDGANGSYPIGALSLGSDGNFYGTTEVGGAFGEGTFFKLAPSGTLKTLYSFSGNAAPVAGVCQGTDGSFYGTTSGGGVGSGFIYKISTGLGPFIRTIPTTAKTRTQVTILGNNLQGTTSVTFNGAKATFTVNETGTGITVTVPAAATTGVVSVVTPARALNSNVPFTVLQ